jgi:hypothetical protein
MSGVAEPERALSALAELDQLRLRELIGQVAAALHAAGLEPSHELAVALLYLGIRIASEYPRRAG